MFKKFTTPILLLLIVIFAFFIRVYFPYNIVFSDGFIKYGDDAIYHMRFLENMLLGGHFPSFFYFDPFVNFPHGIYASLAPFYDLFLASVIWLISFGKPTQEIINKIAPFYPAVLGSIIPIAIYFLSKIIWRDKKISLLAAFLVSIFPPILFKSLLAMNDHHVAEVLFSSLAMMFLFYVLKSVDKKWLFVFLCGFSMGLYLLTWTGAILFFFIIFVFLTIYYLIEFISKRPCNWILIAGAIIFLVPFLMMTPFLGHPNLNIGIYNIYHVITFLLAFFGFFVLWIFGIFIEKKSLKRWMIIVFLPIFSLFFLLILKNIFPYIFERLAILLNGINTNGLAFANFKSFVGEMQPLKLQGAIESYFPFLFFYLLGLCFIVYRFLKDFLLKKRQIRPEYLLLIIWSVITFLITGIIPFFGQRRFDIYLAVNVAILSAFIIIKGLRIGLQALRISSRMEENDSLKWHLLPGSLAMIVIFIFFIFFPFPFNIGMEWPYSLPSVVFSVGKVVENPIVLDSDWYLLLNWLKEKTPNTGMDFYALYQGPKIDKKNGKVADYSYPIQSYGVLANWDFGHAIEYYAHRPVVANPFQMGIGKKENGEVSELGSSVFFFETDEKKAISYLDDLKVKYIITDEKFSTLKYFGVMVKWIQGDTSGYTDESKDSLAKADDSMLVKLHYLDGSETTIENNNIKLPISALRHFRILYESKTTTHIFPNENALKEIKAAKVFEYVKGAKIKGFADSDVEVSISTIITTNQERTFVYEQKIIAKNNSFEFIVPYSTGKQEMSDVSASEYELKIGNWIRKIKVSEDDILQGKTISI